MSPDETTVVSQFLKSYGCFLTDSLDIQFGKGGTLPKSVRKAGASKDMPVQIGSKALVESEYVDQTEGMIAQSAIGFSQLVHH